VKRVLMIAGPNGAGKTTAAMTLLPRFLGIHEFVNADEIARGLNPLQPEAQAVTAGRVMIERIAQLTQQGKNFGFETTCAGLHHRTTFMACKQSGYETALAFLWLPNAQMSIRRVKYRVKSGGHSIPPDVIRRRYKKGLYHLIHDYLPLVDRAVIYDNSNSLNVSQLPIIAEKSPAKSEVTICNDTIWKKF
jgi:predicted ABC-type ATPase